MSETNSQELKKSTNPAIQSKVNSQIGILKTRHPELGDQSVNKLARSVVANQLRVERLKREIKTNADMATEDSLTGLPNKRWFDNELAIRIADAKRKGTSFWLLFMDFNKFKEVNDSYGHHVADLVLKNMKNLKLRSNESIARLAGDEFAQIINGVAGETELLTIIERYNGEIKKFSEEILAKKATLPDKKSLGFLTLAVGICRFEKDLSKENLLTTADAAMYEAKRTGNQVVLGEIRNGEVQFRKLKPTT